MKTKAPSLLLLGLTLTLAACSMGAPGAPSPGTPAPATPVPATPGPATPVPGTPVPPTNPPAGTAPDLNGRTFLSTRITVDGVDKVLVANTRIRLDFRDGQIGASVGCNSMGGTYTIDDGTLMFHGGAMTEMGCDPPRHAQDDWLVGYLASQPSIAINGHDLVLTSGTTTVALLDREVAEPDQPLGGLTWTLSSIISGEAVSSVPVGIRATIKFNDDGSVNIEPGCNTGGGSYTIKGQEIVFGDLFTTKMACMGSAMDVENAFLTVLSGNTVTFAIEAGSLTIMAGDHGLQFSAS